MDPLITDTLELLGIRSDGGTRGEVAAQRWVADKLASWGWDVDVWEDDPSVVRTADGHPGMEVDRGRVVGVIGRPRGSSGSRLVLGHTDVVPGGPAPGFTDTSMVGRGSADMKAGLVAGMYAARDAGGDVVVCAVSCEEDGGIGAFLALRHGLRADSCVIPEPTSLAIVPANAGSLTFRVTLPGVAAHGARRWEGRSALEAVPETLRRLQELARTRGQSPPDLLSGYPIPYPISIGRIHGGEWASTVMSEVTLEGRYGVALGEALDHAAAEFEGALVGTGASVQWVGGRFAPAGLPVDHPLVHGLAEHHRAVTGEDAVVTGTTYGSDLRKMLAAGIPTVLYGPGDAALAHGEDEEVPLRQVHACRDVLARWLRAQSGGG
jgi:acetylornithine deacetylase